MLVIHLNVKKPIFIPLVTSLKTSKHILLRNGYKLSPFSSGHWKEKTCSGFLFNVLAADLKLVVPPVRKRVHFPAGPTNAEVVPSGHV